MARKPDADGYFQTPDALHYNVRCCGDVVFNRVTARHFKELTSDIIEWVWIVEQKREATKAEIKKLCAGRS